MNHISAKIERLLALQETLCKENARDETCVKRERKEVVVIRT